MSKGMAQLRKRFERWVHIDRPEVLYAGKNFPVIGAYVLELQPVLTLVLFQNTAISLNDRIRKPCSLEIYQDSRQPSQTFTHTDLFCARSEHRLLGATGIDVILQNMFDALGVRISSHQNLFATRLHSLIGEQYKTTGSFFSMFFMSNLSDFVHRRHDG